MLCFFISVIKNDISNLRFGNFGSTLARTYIYILLTINVINISIQMPIEKGLMSAQKLVIGCGRGTKNCVNIWTHGVDIFTNS